MNRRQFSATLASGLLATPLVDKSLGTASRLLVRAAPRVNGERLNRHLAEISRFGANPQGGVTRLAYSDADKQAREYVFGLMRDAKLTPAIDAAGNIIASRPGATRRSSRFSSARTSIPSPKAVTTTVTSGRCRRSKSRRR